MEDKPCCRLIASVIKQDSQGLIVCKYLVTGDIVRQPEEQITPIGQFGVSTSVSAGMILAELTGVSTAHYSDGSPRTWQPEIVEAWKIKGEPLPPVIHPIQPVVFEFDKPRRKKKTEVSDDE